MALGLAQELLASLDTLYYFSVVPCPVLHPGSLQQSSSPAAAASPFAATSLTGEAEQKQGSIEVGSPLLNSLSPK